MAVAYMRLVRLTLRPGLTEEQTAGLRRTLDRIKLPYHQEADRGDIPV
jgi:hypothetical protein